MKKLFILPILLLTLFVNMNNVKADTNFPIDYSLSDVQFPDYSYQQMKQRYNNDSEIFNSVLDSFLSSYESFSSDYPYYWLQIFYSDSRIQFEFYAYSSIPKITSLTSLYLLPFELHGSCLYSFSDPSSSDCSNISLSLGSNSITFYYGNSSSAQMFMSNYFFSNFDLYFDNPTGRSLIYTSSDGQSEWLSTDNSPVPSAYEYFELAFFDNYIPSSYTEVDLNQYDYVILSLKDYSQSQFTSTLYTLGSLCLTPVYNYGMTQKNSYSFGYKTPACSPYYDTFTPVNLHILSSDLSNNAVYYIKSSDISKPNKIKYDSTRFNISTFNSTTGLNPSIVINGRTYSPIPYNQLTDTAIISTEEGYVSGSSENIFDITGDSDYVSNLFSQPFNTLKSVWVSLLSFFNLIATFISLLPPTLSSFLIVSFALSLILGVLKLIL